MGRLQEGKKREGPHRAPQIHERMSEGVAAPKRNEGVEETSGLVDALCRLSVPGDRVARLRVQHATLTGPYDEPST
jgi:hypothetical protein